MSEREEAAEQQRNRPARYYYNQSTSHHGDDDEYVAAVAPSSQQRSKGPVDDVEQIELNTLESLVYNSNVLSQITSSLSSSVIDLDLFQPLPFTDYSLFNEQYGFGPFHFYT